MSRHLERASLELRRGDPVVLQHNTEMTLIRAVERLPDAGPLTPELDQSPAALILTAERLTALGIAEPEGPSAAMVPPGSSRTRLLELAAGAASRITTPLATAPRAARPSEHAGLELARRGWLLPSVLATPVPAQERARIEAMVADSTLLKVSATEALATTTAGNTALQRVSEAQIPLTEAEHTRFVLFREGDGALEHVAVLIGDPADWPAAVPLRLHSACLTGDLFGSLRCDCGEQLRGAVAAISAAGGGILLYLAQEGRGIGLANKLRAYSLQDSGLDTLDADQILGFGEDERSYAIAVAMLRELATTSVRLLTNNPAKIAALEAAGVYVAGRAALHGQVNGHNRAYLTAKAERSGHWLGESLAGD